MSECYVKHFIKDEIATVEFYHPKSNSFPSEQLESLIKLLHDLGEDTTVKIILLKSKGNKVFSAGASFDELLTIDEFEKGKKFFLSFAKLILAMRNCPKFIVGCISGKVVGGGVGIVSACDYAIADATASIRLSELSIGIGPFVVEPAITRRIGLNAVSTLTLNPIDWKTPEWAKEKGLFDKVVSDEEKCLEKTLDFAKQLSVYSLEAMKNLKSIFWKGTEDWDQLMVERAEMSGRLVLSDFTKETLKKFKTKS